MKAYYHARAREYDDWWLAEGLYESAPPGWAEERDGTRWQVYKRFFTGAGLAAELGGGRVLHEGRWFVLVAA